MSTFSTFNTCFVLLLVIRTVIGIGQPASTSLGKCSALHASCNRHADCCNATIGCIRGTCQQCTGNNLTGCQSFTCCNANHNCYQTKCLQCGLAGTTCNLEDACCDQSLECASSTTNLFCRSCVGLENPCSISSQCCYESNCIGNKCTKCALTGDHCKVSAGCCNADEECRRGICRTCLKVGDVCREGDTCCDNSFCEDGVCTGCVKASVCNLNQTCSNCSLTFDKCGSHESCCSLNDACVNGYCAKRVVTGGSCGKDKLCMLNDTCFGGVCTNCAKGKACSASLGCCSSREVCARGKCRRCAGAHDSCKLPGETCCPGHFCNNGTNCVKKVPTGEPCETDEYCIESEADVCWEGLCTKCGRNGKNCTDDPQCCSANSNCRFEQKATTKTCETCTKTDCQFNEECCDKYTCYRGLCQYCAPRGMRCSHKKICCRYKDTCHKGECKKCVKTGDDCSCAGACCDAKDTCLAGKCQSCSKLGHHCNDAIRPCKQTNVCFEGITRNCSRAGRNCTTNDDCCTFDFNVDKNGISHHLGDVCFKEQCRECSPLGWSCTTDISCCNSTHACHEGICKNCSRLDGPCKLDKDCCELAHECRQGSCQACSVNGGECNTKKGCCDDDDICYGGFCRNKECNTLKQPCGEHYDCCGYLENEENTDRLPHKGELCFNSTCSKACAFPGFECRNSRDCCNVTNGCRPVSTGRRRCMGCSRPGMECNQTHHCCNPIEKYFLKPIPIPLTSPTTWGNICYNKTCQSCSPLDWPCTDERGCCDSKCYTGFCKTCQTEGLSCANGEECCDDVPNCNNKKVCEKCRQAGDPCRPGLFCCKHLNCYDMKCQPCALPGTSCDSDAKKFITGLATIGGLGSLVTSGKNAICCGKNPTCNSKSICEACTKTGHVCDGNKCCDTFAGSLGSPCYSLGFGQKC